MAESKCLEQIDWTKCILCQTNSKESLMCPAKSKRTESGAGYKTMAGNLNHFHELNALPFNIDIGLLNNGAGIETTLNENNAKWHKTCSLKVSTLKLDRMAKRKETCAAPEQTISKKVYTRLNASSDDIDVSVDTSKKCLFCSQGNEFDKLHEARTFQLDARIRKLAYVVQDQELIAKLSAGDLIAIEAKYHLGCLTNLHNKARGMERKKTLCDIDDETLKGIALAELISYIEESRREDNVRTFRLADITKLYKDRLEKLGIEVTERINSTHLKQRILRYLPALRAYNKGRDVFLAYGEDVGSVLLEEYQEDRDELGVMMTKVANMIREDMFSTEVNFTGAFDQNSQVKSVPQSLLALISMIINGPSIQEQSNNECLIQPVLTVSQLVTFNSFKKRRKNATTSSLRRSKDRETPLPIYVGLKVHSLTRQRQLVDSLFALGISASYDRILEIITVMGVNICDYYKRINVVCPPQMLKEQFVTAAADNIDHNPSSTTFNGSFHGTGLSLFQNITTDTNIPQADDSLSRSLMTMKKEGKYDLPISYTNVQPASLLNGDIYVPPSPNNPLMKEKVWPEQIQNEYKWLEHVQNTYSSEVINQFNISWAAYHASLLPEPSILPSINAMLPLFHEEASSVAMLRHCFEIVQASVQWINPGQIPVISVDQPLFAKMKQLQWSNPGLYGEDKFVVVLGGLHTEMTSLKLLGQWLHGSGWVEAITQANIATAGVAESFLTASHVTRTRYTHQVTACALYILLKNAYTDYETNSTLDDNPANFEVWCEQKKKESPQFFYWYTCFELELLVMTYVRSLRTGNFDLYRETIAKLTPWFFSLNYTNYARWMPIHIRDMDSLDVNHPEVAKEFQEGKFVIAKSPRKFSLIAIDHGHEQNNCVLKEEGGIIGLTHDEDALVRWAVAGPEIVRVLSEFESSMISKVQTAASCLGHHEETKASQRRFVSHVNSLVEVMDSFGNPFQEESQDLLRLHSRDIMGPDSINCLKTLQQKGQEQYHTYNVEILQERSKPISDPIRRNKVLLFKEQAQKGSTKSRDTITLLKNESSLFARLYIACETRQVDLNNFFSHENHPFPPSLSNFGQLRQGKKSELLDCLEQYTGRSDSRPTTDVTIIDGAVLVNVLRPSNCKTFNDYATNVFTPYVMKELNKTCRVDIVWDQYFENSLKAFTRQKRTIGAAQRRRVESGSPVPSNWQQFLRDDGNKTDLFRFLGSQIISSEISGKELVVTDGASVQCIPTRDTLGLAPCNHEEADSRIFVHAADAVNRGYSKILIRTVDTDVVVLSISAAAELGATEVWIALGTGKDFRYVAAHEISAALGPRKSMALPVFHSYTGCDTVSFFAHVGKKTAWKVWDTFEELTDTLCSLRGAPSDISAGASQSLERFTILLYDRTSTEQSINKVRKMLFTRKGRQMTSLPPTQHSLYQHIKRAVLQGGHKWGQVTNKNLELPSPEHWGWTNSEKWEPLWTTLPKACDTCPELLHCKCRKRCTSCKCVQANLACSTYCSCRSECENV